MRKKIAAILKELPQKPGVYVFKDKTGRILYIGKAVKLKNRVRSYFNKKSHIFKADFHKLIYDIDYIKTANEKEAWLLECELIKKYHPHYNIQWQDDKSYFWVRFSDDEWPRVQLAHKGQGPRTNSKWQMAKTKSLPKNSEPLAISNKQYANIGPFISGRELKQVLRSLRKILPYRTCKNSFDKPCLQWHLGLCPAHGTSDKPPMIGDQKKTKSLAYHLSLNTLRQLLRLYSGEPIRIEAYDISNIHGNYATGSMIVFSGAKPKKSDYRRFKIKTVQGANDVAMIKEILKRRFNHPEWPYPDLILIDGGRPQLNAAHLAYSQWQIANSKKPFAISHWPFATIALAKQEEEIYTQYSDRALKLSSLPAAFGLIFQAIRNEAHRFAIFYYRTLHRKVIKK